MNSYNSSLTNTYSDRHPAPLSRSEHTAVTKEIRPVSESVREGQQLCGEIINRTTTDVTIRLTNGQTLQARLDVSVPLSIGQTASFEVTHADPALISLRILQDEAAFAQNALIQKALTAADLPVTSRNAELVNTLLQHNLPISRESIQSLIRQSNAYPNADINTLALLTQHKLPITQATLTQFEAYQHYEHQILPQLENLARSLSELVVSSDSSLSGLVQILQNLSNQATVPEVLLQAPEQSPNADAVSPNRLPTAGADVVSPNTLPTANADTTSHNPLPTVDGTLTETVTNPGQFNNIVQNPTTDRATSAQTPVTLVSTEAASANMLPSFTANTASPTMLQSTENPSARFTMNPGQLINTPQNQTTAAEVSASTQDSFVQQLLTRWTLSPTQLSVPVKVKEFYLQLREDLAELHSTLTASSAAMRSARDNETFDNPLERLLSDTASATGRLQDNLEFMNMLNRIFPYVQFPIRFSDKTAHGELYVYTKKEKLRNESGSISVLLHLDMEALGPTDVYLSLTGNQLLSRFYLDDPAVEGLFTGHLPELKETLADKGFSVNFELVPRKQEEDPVREFLNSHDSSGLSRFTFDCRA